MDIQEIISHLGITPNEMQRETADALLQTENNTLILSPTGSGKTLAYLLPLSQLIDTDSDSVQAIVVVPGRELAIQSSDVLRNMKAGIRGYACYGGRPTMDEHREIRTLKPQIIFGTPGRLNDHIKKSNFAVDTVRFIIIDEFDKCLEMGFQNEMLQLLESIPHNARRVFLSATDVTENTDDDKGLSTEGFSRIDFRTEHDEDRVTVYSVHSETKDKLNTLLQLLLDFGQQSSIVFLNYRESVERATAFLSDNGFVVSAYHGGLDQRGREDAVYKFANGSANILVSTNLGSRGLDIPDVENIIHYHLPETEEIYTHRVGRTARWDKHGRTFFILSDGETIPDYVDAEIREYQPQPSSSKAPLPLMTTLYIGKGKKDRVSKGDVVGFLCKEGGLKGSDIGRIDVKDYYSYAAVIRNKAKSAINNADGRKIKGKKTRVEEMQ